MKNMDRLADINSLAATGKLQEAVAQAQAWADAAPGDALAVFTLGRMLWRSGERHRAMGLYARAAELDPEGPGAMALEHAREIDAFYNRDLYNP